MDLNPRPLHRVIGVMAIIIGLTSFYGAIVRGLDPYALVTGIVFVLIGAAIVQYSRNDKHYLNYRSES